MGVGEPSAQVVDTGHGSVDQRQKKAAGNAAHQQGDECVEVLASQPHHPLLPACGAVGIVYELPKKGGVP